MNDSNGNPIEYKKLLAHDIVTQYYNAEDANLAEEHFRKSVQEKIVTYERIQIDINDFKTDEKLSKLLINKNIVSSNSEFKRLLKQNGVKLNGGLISEDVLISKINSDDKISIGKRTNIQIII